MSNTDHHTEPDLSSGRMPAATREFLNAISPPGTGLTEIFFRFNDKKAPRPRKQWVSDFDDLDWGELMELNSVGYHIFFGVGARMKRTSTEDYVGFIGALWADLDAKDFDSAADPEKDNFDPAAVENGKRLALEEVARLPAELQPSVVVDTGNGMHLYWLLREVIALQNDHIRARIKAVIKQLGQILGGDSVSNLNRFLRVPGTKNVKPAPLVPKPCTILKADYDRRFDFADLEAFAAPASTLVTVKPTTPDPAPPMSPSPIGSIALDHLGLSTKIRSLIEEGKTDDDSYPSRSEADAAVIAALVNAGLDDGQIRAVFENVAWKIGDRFRQSGDGYLAESIAGAREFVAANPLPPRAPRLSEPVPSDAPATPPRFARPLSEILREQEFPEPDFLVKPLIQAGSIGFVAAEPKMFKSWITLDIAFNLALGRPVLGHFEVPRPRRVLLVQEEDSVATVRGRLKALSLGADGAWPEDDNFYWAVRTGLEIFPTQPAPENVNDKFKNLIRDIELYRPDLVVIDALNRIHAGDENVQNHMSAVMRRFEEIRRTFGCAILLVHHFRKGSREKSGRGNQRLRGSSALGAWGENSLFIMRRGRDGGLTIAPESKHIHIEEFGVRLEEIDVEGQPGVRFVHLGDPAPGCKVENIEKVFRTVAELHSELPETVTIVGITARTGLSNSAVRNHLRALKDDGRVTEHESQIEGQGQRKFLYIPVAAPRSGDLTGTGRGS